MVGSKRHSSAKNKNRPSSSSRSVKDKVAVAREYDEGLVGSRVKVWWPIDRKYYKGVVDSYARSKKKHRVLYDDGEVENLDMKKERWELIEDDDAEADEISLQDESGDESCEATPEPLEKKKAKSNGKASVKGKMEDDMLKKKQKIDSSAKSKSKTRSGKVQYNSEKEKEKAKSAVKKGEILKDVEEESPKPETVKNGKMGDIGGKIVAAASRMSGRFRSNEKRDEKEKLKTVKTSKKRPSSSSEAVHVAVKKQRTSSKKIKSKNIDGKEEGDDDDTSDDVDISDDETKPKVLKSSKKVSESKKPKQKRSSSSSEDVSEDGNKAEDDTSDEELNPLVKLYPSKEKGQEKEETKSLSEADFVKVNKPRTSSKKTKSNRTDDEDGEEQDGDHENGDDEDGDHENGDDEDENNEEGEEAEDDMIEDESMPKSPETVEATMEQLKDKEKEEGEETVGKETEVEEESS